MDSIYSFPGLILAIAIAAVLGPGLMNIIIAIAVLYIPTYFRIVRGQTLSVKQELYVEAARSLGAKSWTLLWKYIFPNVIPSVVIIFSVNVADAILTEAGLSFIGLGIAARYPGLGHRSGPRAGLPAARLVADHLPRLDGQHGHTIFQHAGRKPV